MERIEEKKLKLSIYNSVKIVILNFVTVKKCFGIIQDRKPWQDI